MSYAVGPIPEVLGHGRIWFFIVHCVHIALSFGLLDRGLPVAYLPLTGPDRWFIVSGWQ